ncbi:MAG: phosphodiesterase [Actinomycetota bacterium]|nr:phosphodiesterase [Actinomycetota bacterium]
MRIGLLSDTHGDPVAWEKCLDAFGEVDLVLHAGDVLYHGIFNPITEDYNPKRLVELLNSFDHPVFFARGNCDSEVDQLALDHHILSEFAFASAGDIKFLVNHGHKASYEELLRMASRAGIDVVHRGHTHVPEIRVVEGVTFINAGSCSLPKQEDGIPTAALIEDRLIRIIDLNTKKEIIKGELP